MIKRRKGGYSAKDTGAPKPPPPTSPGAASPTPEEEELLHDPDLLESLEQMRRGEYIVRRPKPSDPDPTETS